MVGVKTVIFQNQNRELLAEVPCANNDRGGKMARTVFTVITPREIRLVVIPLLTLVLLGSVVQRVERLLYGVRPGVTLEGQPMGGLFPHEVRRIVEDLAEVHSTPPVNAQIDKATGEIIPGQMGRMVDVDGTVQMVLQASPRESLKLVYTEVRPEITFEMLASLHDVLGVFHTVLMGSPGRIQNIRLCMTAIDGTVVGPGRFFPLIRWWGNVPMRKGTAQRRLSWVAQWWMMLEVAFVRFPVPSTMPCDWQVWRL